MMKLNFSNFSHRAPGDTLPPFLFIIALGHALREATQNQNLGCMLTHRKSSRNPTKIVSDIDFAYNALIFATFEKAQLLLNRKETAAEEVSMYINYKKTEHMIYHIYDGDLRT